MTISQRRARLRRRLVAAELDAILITDLVNVRYLSGFTGSNAAMLVYADGRGAVRGRSAGAGNVSGDPAVRALVGRAIQVANDRLVASRNSSAGTSQNCRKRLNQLCHSKGRKLHFCHSQARFIPGVALSL